MFQGKSIQTKAVSRRRLAIGRIVRPSGFERTLSLIKPTSTAGDK